MEERRRRSRGVLLKPVGFRPGGAIDAGRRARQSAGAYVNGFRRRLEGGGLGRQSWAVFYRIRAAAQYRQKTLAVASTTGAGDFKAHMTGVVALVARGIADPDKLAHIGWSYGGFMTARTIADHPLQGGDGRRRRNQHVEHVNQRHSERADRLLRRHPEQRTCRSGSIRDDTSTGDDADADLPAPMTSACRPGRPTSCTRVEGSRQGDGAGVLPARRTRVAEYYHQKIECRGSTTGSRSL